MGTSIEEVCLPKIILSAGYETARNDNAHNLSHHQRVARTAEYLQSKEGGDAFLISAASWCHDWYSYMGPEGHVSPEAMEKLSETLEQIGIPAHKIAEIRGIVELHDNFDWAHEHNPSLELQIVQDADRIDALGPVGIARVFYVSAINGMLMGTPDDMHRLDEDFHQGQMTSAIQHFYTKLLRIPEVLNTKTAREIGEKFVPYIEGFLEGYKNQWEGRFLEGQ